jgi:hypothetical protein
VVVSVRSCGIDTPFCNFGEQLVTASCADHCDTLYCRDNLLAHVFPFSSSLNCGLFSIETYHVDECEVAVTKREEGVEYRRPLCL